MSPTTEARVLNLWASLKCVLRLLFIMVLAPSYSLNSLLFFFFYPQRPPLHFQSNLETVDEEPPYGLCHHWNPIYQFIHSLVELFFFWFSFPFSINPLHLFGLTSLPFNVLWKRIHKNFRDIYFLISVTYLVHPNAINLYLWLIATQVAELKSLAHNPMISWNDNHCNII